MLLGDYCYLSGEKPKSMEEKKPNTRDLSALERAPDSERRLKIIWQWAKDGTIDFKEFRALILGGYYK
jgi:hypothetical protein